MPWLLLFFVPYDWLMVPFKILYLYYTSGSKPGARGPQVSSERYLGVHDLCMYYIRWKKNSEMTNYSPWWSTSHKHNESKAQPGGAEGAQAPPLSNQNIDVYFLVFHQHCTVSRDQVHCKMFFGSTTGVTTHTLSNQAVMNFLDLRNIEAAFFIPACFALPYITWAGCCRALPAWKQAWHLNYQECRLMCSLYVTKLGPS